MDRINGANTVDLGGGRRGFRNKNRAAGIPGTQIEDSFLNAIQEEVMRVIEGAGLTPKADNLAQLFEALRRLHSSDVFFFTASRAFVVPPGWDSGDLTLLGAGGAGGGCTGSVSGGAGGGGGGFFRGRVPLTPGATVQVTVGAGGAPIAANTVATGGAGGTTSFGAYASATGGTGGPAGIGGLSSNQSPGGYGVGGEADRSLRLVGRPGRPPYVMDPGRIAGGVGGGTFLSADNPLDVYETTLFAATPGLLPGVGGNGGCNGSASGAGANGLAILAR